MNNYQAQIIVWVDVEAGSDANAHGESQEAVRVIEDALTVSDISYSSIEVGNVLIEAEDDDI